MIPPTDRESMIQSACADATDAGRAYGEAFATGAELASEPDGVLESIAAGDIPEDWGGPNLSGEWADEPSPADVLALLPDALDGAVDDDVEDEVLTAWEDAATAAWSDALGRMASRILRERRGSR